MPFLNFVADCYMVETSFCKLLYMFADYKYFYIVTRLGQVCVDFYAICYTLFKFSLIAIQLDELFI